MVECDEWTWNSKIMEELLMRKLAMIGVCAAFLCAVGVASAATVDFDDMTLGSVYNSGDSFTTGGVLVTVGDFFLTGGGTTSGAATVTDAMVADGGGNEMSINNVNLSFDFGAPTINGLSLQFGEQGGDLNLNINGDLQKFADFTDVDNSVIGGVNVYVIGPNQGKGGLFAIGLINSFAVGGQELSVDNLVANCVPEPATIGLLLLGGIAVGRRKRR